MGTRAILGEASLAAAAARRVKEVLLLLRLAWLLERSRPHRVNDDSRNKDDARPPPANSCDDRRRRFILGDRDRTVFRPTPPPFLFPRCFGEAAMTTTE